MTATPKVFGPAGINGGDVLRLKDGADLQIGSAPDGSLSYVAARRAAVLKMSGDYFEQEGLGDRINLKWIANTHGKPGLQADHDADLGTALLTDPDFEILGTNAISASVTQDAEGGILLTTAGADDDQVILLPNLAASYISPWNLYTWGTDRQTRWEAILETQAAITNMTIWAGLKLTNVPVTATDANQCFFRYQNGVNSGGWQAISSIADSDDAADSGVTVAASTLYHLVIDIQSDRTAQMYINGVLVETSAALTDAIDLIPYVGVMADGEAAAKIVGVHGLAISRQRGAA